MRAVRQGLAWLVLGVLGCWLSGSGLAQAQEAVRERGRLSESDQQLESGEYRDTYDFDGESGQVVAIDMTSSEFDTYIFVRSDDDEDFTPDNDDFDGEKGHSRLLITLPADGTYTVYATSHASGEVGRYNLEILFDEDALADVPEGDQEYTYEGQLSRSDGKLESGEYRDNYTVQARSGQYVTIVLESQDFDPYLFVRSDSDDDLSLDNEDDDGSATVARIELEMPVDASMEIAVTSDAPGERGDYTLTVLVTDKKPRGGASNDDDEELEDDDEMQAGETIEESGSLSRNDETISTGEYADVYEYEWKKGETYRVLLESTKFDPYVFVRCEEDDELKWDDDGSGDTAEVEVEVPESGVYRVFVTSHEPGERGDYTLTIEPLGRGGSRRGDDEEESDDDGRAADNGEDSRTREAGSLADGDEELNTGEFYDEYDLSAEVGQSVVVTVASDDFSPYLIVIDENDSEQRWVVPGADGEAEVEFVAPSSSSYRVIVTSEQPADEGDYELSIDVQGASEGDDEMAGVRRERGELAEGDETIQSGEFCDIYTFDGEAGQRVVLDLRSDDFDTYVMLRSAENTEERWDNDDLEGDKHRSQLTVELPADGEYSAYVTSYAVGETGAYSLTITVGEAATAPAGPAERREAGELAEGDAQLPQGQYVDWYEVEGVPGQQLEIELTSDAFDTLVTVLCPNGEVLSNDDFNAQSSRSRIEFQAEDFGVHRIGVTSYAAGATGAYELSIRAGEVAETPVVEDEPTAEGEDAEFFAESGAREGELGPGDDRLTQGEYCDHYSFEAERGQRVIIEMQSTEVDAWLWLTGPDDIDVQNDDFLGERDARIVFDVEKAGRYRIAATTRAGDETGRYTLRLEFADPADESAGLPRAPEGRRVFGLFVGISDYEGTDSDLKYCDKDARRAYQAFQEDFDMTEDEAVLLVDEDATLEAVESALRDLAARAGPDDMLVFFYSGHGGQEKRDAPDYFDPDGKDETLVLYDQPLLDDHLRELLQDSAVGLTLFVFDSCHSGGFAKDVVVRPGTIGFFSSEEDVLSLLAKERHAGGFLSLFFYEAFHDDRDDVDLNDDDTMTAHELSFFLAERYRQDVRAARPQAAVYEDGPIDPGDNLSYQRLVIDRGGVDPNTPLWSW